MRFEGKTYAAPIKVKTFAGTPDSVNDELTDWLATPSMGEVVKTAHSLYVDGAGKFHSTASVYFVEHGPEPTIEASVG